VWKRFAAFLGRWSVVGVLCAMTLAQFTSFIESLWLAKWAQGAYGDGPDKVWLYAGPYAAITVLIVLFNALRTVGLYWVFLVASRKIHSRALGGVLASSMAFFDTTPLGRVLNRFSKELQLVDVNIGMPMSNVLKFGLRLIFSIILIIYGTNPLLLIIFIPLSGGWYVLQKYYRNSARELQRLDSISKSPIYSAFNESLQGCATIQAFGEVERFAALQNERFDYNLRASLVAQGVGIWLQVWLQVLSSVVIGAAALFCVISGERSANDPSTSATSRAALAGLALTYAPQLTDNVNNVLRSFMQVETNMVSVERLFQYVDLPPEESPSPPTPRVDPPPSWPARGEIEFKDVVMGYRVGLPDVLKGATFTINGGEKIGVCGRTGSGKSTLLSCLFRLVELRGGAVLIDGVDIATTRLATLRSRLAIIPQDPIFFTGSLRYNLDPRGDRDDVALIELLRKCACGAMLEHADGLMMPLEGGGSNLSAGQRQLLCMARALLMKAKVLVLDEATANLDMETDQLIQQTLSAQLGDATTMTIAHRLNTIMSSDRVLVMDAGRVAEMAPPDELKNNPSSIFARLVKAAQQEGH